MCRLCQKGTKKNMKVNLLFWRDDNVPNTMMMKKRWETLKKKTKGTTMNKRLEKGRRKIKERRGTNNSWQYV